MNVFLEQNYRKILRLLVEERRQTEPSFTFQELAEAARIQKSYLSKVVTGRADLTTDQLFLICRHLDLDAETSHYLELLLERERTGVEMRRQDLARQIEAARSPHLESHAHLQTEAVSVNTSGMAEYYLDPFNQIVHACLFLPLYQRDASILGRDLGQPAQRVAAALSTLERLGLIRRQGNKSELLIQNLHLRRLSPVYRPWRNQLKLMAIGRLDMVRDSDSYSVANIFSADRATFEAIRLKFLHFLRESDDLIKAAPDHNVYQMAFDLFPWTDLKEGAS